MADTPDNTDVKTRANLSYIWSIGSIVMLGYILYMWGGKTEILTLVIGLIGGTMLGSISGVFFGGATSTKKPDTSVTQTGDQPQVTVNPTPPAPNPPPPVTE